MRGIPKAAVFPVPVAACPIMFWVALRRSGITFSWIGEGVLNPFFSSAVRVLAVRPRSLNVVVIGENKRIKV